MYAYSVNCNVNCLESFKAKDSDKYNYSTKGWYGAWNATNV